SISVGSGGATSPAYAVATAAAGTASRVVPTVWNDSGAGFPATAAPRPTTPPGPTRCRTVPPGSPGRRPSTAPSTTTNTSGRGAPATASTVPGRGSSQRARSA